MEQDFLLRLRELSPSASDVNPAAIDPAVIAAAGRRRRQRQGLALAASAMAVAAAITIPIVTLGSGGSNASLRVAQTPPALKSTQTSSLSRCQLGDLRVTTGNSGAAAGTVSLALVFTNVSAASCTVSGKPRVFGVTGSVKTTLSDEPLATIPADKPLAVAPGASIEAIIFGLANPQNGAAQCPLPYSSFIVQIPNSSETHVVSTFVPYLGASFPACSPAKIGPFGKPGSFGSFG